MRNVEVRLHRDFAIGTTNPRLFGAFVEHLGRCIYGGIFEPGHPTADAQGFRQARRRRGGFFGRQGKIQLDGVSLTMGSQHAAFGREADLLVRRNPGGKEQQGEHQ